jgi:hypothetical protein
MPIIKLTAADAMQTKVAPAAIYKCEISKIEGPKKSSSGKSYTYFVDIRITDGEYENKTRTLCFNTESSSPSLLGEMQFFPVAYFHQVLAATEGKLEADVTDIDLDTDSLLHAPFDAQWNVQTVDGRLINTIDAFYPAGYGANAPGF